MQKRPIADQSKKPGYVGCRHLLLPLPLSFEAPQLRGFEAWQS
jgi:hypothetical protein